MSVTYEVHYESNQDVELVEAVDFHSSPAFHTFSNIDGKPVFTVPAHKVSKIQIQKIPNRPNAYDKLKSDYQAEKLKAWQAVSLASDITSLNNAKTCGYANAPAEVQSPSKKIPDFNLVDKVAALVNPSKYTWSENDRADTYRVAESLLAFLSDKKNQF